MSKKYRMSSAQKRMFAITEMHGNDIVYNVPMLWKIEGQIDVERLQRSFSQLCARHEPLRTYFVHQKDKFLQVVKEEGDIFLDYEETSEEQIQQLFKEHVRPFNLNEAPLMRAKIVRISSNEHVLMLDIHHIIFDDGSKHVLLSDLCQFYNNEEIPPLRIQYKDYSAWLNSRDMREQERYWTEEFSGEVSTLDLKTDYPRPQQQQYGGRSIDLLLPLELKARVKQLSHHSGATEYMILLACFMVLMNRYTRQDEIVVGSPIAGRVHAETDEMLGMFVNTLAIRGEFRTVMTFLTLLSQIQERCLKAYENQEYPFDELVEKIGVERDPSRNPLFDVMFVLQKNEQGSFKLGDTLLTSMDVGLTVAKFDLTVSVEEVEEGYNVNWEYCDALFAADTLQHMALQFKELVGEIMAQPDLVLSELGLITSAEQKRVLAEFNNTERECNLEKTAIMLFEDQVARAPEHIAVEFQGRVLTYRELNARANAVGAALLEKGVSPDQIVALIATRSLDMIIGIYGILKAGAAYLPIDPEQPLERIRYIIEDSGTSHIVFEENTKKTAAALEEQQGVQILNVAEVQEEIEENPQPSARPEHLAYVIYTSGTTGQPKGVLVENRNLVNLVSWQRATGDLHEDSVMLQKSTYIFDAAVWEIFSILLAGGKLALATESENRDPKELLELIAKTQVTHALIVPSSFRMILEYAELHQLAEQLMSLQKIYLGAEPLTPDLISKYTQLTGSGTDRLVNLYGPTEATVCATYMKLEEGYGGNVPIGRPLWNTQIYILQDDWLCGYGIPGELCIGGAGVARGYLNRTDLTNEKFVSNPYVPGGRIYRTGDLARWKTDGTIEYLGRIGDQVKIRGYRVEPGEIETHLRNIESVQDAVVVVKTDNTRSDYLCAYVVGEGELDGERIRENLRSILPSYMVPSYVVQLEALPLTRNGKLDKKALPEPDRTSTQTYTAPQNALEEVIATVFREVLGLEQVGIDDDFYTLGGDSIKAIRILSKMREQGYDLGVRTIMQGRTIRGMSSAVTVSVASTAEQGEVTGQVNPTPIQCQFWSESLGEPHHFNQSFLLESMELIHETALRQALDAITAHHDMLRAVYRESVQIIRPIASGAAYEMTVMDYRSFTDLEEAWTAMHQQADQMQRSLDLVNGPLIRVGLFHTNERDYVLLIVHHLLIDGVSWRILLEDLQQAYASILAGQAVTLPPKTGSYAGWSKALERYGKSAELQQELGYWQTVEAQMEESGKHW
ncbi:hypothetical protein BK124_30605, partial [Paenibacillus amylolyticus]|uniref:non-ribosomal peptide synthetase n=1 Tax=Paenibacillus amylolyticus TaxID=1451 RepID=UPI00097B5269